MAKKIIGKNGKNMKKILNHCWNKFNQNSKDFLKLWLWGWGSLHKEGTKKWECND